MLDEPSIGLHARDNDRLLHSLEQLRNLGNTVLVVEHDEDTIRRADYVVDLGPARGMPGDTWWHRESRRILRLPQNRYGKISCRRTTSMPSPGKRRSPNGKAIQILGAHANNLKDVDVSLPLGFLRW